MDFGVTLAFIHLLLTTYYASAFPTSLIYWLVLVLSTVVQIIWAEQLCIKREMSEGLGVSWKNDERPDDNVRASTAQAQHKRSATATEIAMKPIAALNASLGLAKQGYSPVNTEDAHR